jgi:phosphatidate phosphatase APP1
MGKLKSGVRRMVGMVDELSDSLRYGLKRIRGFGSPLMIHPYLGFGTREKIILNGRVLEDTGIIHSENEDTILENLINMYRRFETDEVPNARLLAEFQGLQQETVADEEGYFRLEFNLGNNPDERVWQDVALELLHPLDRSKTRVRAVGKVMIPPSTARLGVISDIDDTVVWSNVTNKLKMILTVALLNERTRMPFKGVAAFYHALQQGADGNQNNPIFYVSKSPWNLYSLLIEFFKIHDIPSGPLLLRDFGDHQLFFKDSHKLTGIELILNLYPNLPFILIGDSGEQDPEIYARAVSLYPDRIRAIYIRSIDPSPVRTASIDKLVEEVRESGSQLILAPDTEFAAVHAAGEGMISTGALAAIRAGKNIDLTLESATDVVPEEI